jgi:hypothetical protein
VYAALLTPVPACPRPPRDEREEAYLRKAEMEAAKMSNMMEHEEEIYSRPARTWFQSERQKKEAARMAKVASEGEPSGCVGVCVLLRKLLSGISRCAVLWCTVHVVIELCRRRCCAGPLGALGYALVQYTEACSQPHAAACMLLPLPGRDGSTG